MGKGWGQLDQILHVINKLIVKTVESPVPFPCLVNTCHPICSRVQVGIRNLGPELDLETFTLIRCCVMVETSKSPESNATIVV